LLSLTALVDGSARVDTFAEGIGEFGEIRKVGNTVTIEIDGARGRLAEDLVHYAKESGEQPQVCKTDPTVSIEIRAHFPHDRDDVAIVIDGFCTPIVDRRYPYVVISDGGDAHRVTNLSRHTMIDIVEAKLILDTRKRRRRPVPGIAQQPDSRPRRCGR